MVGLPKFRLEGSNGRIAPIAAVQPSGTVSPKRSFVGAAANGWVELECAASSRHANGSSGGSAVPSRSLPTSSVCNELGCGSSRKAVRAKSHRCFRSTSPACGRGSYRRSACAHRRVPLLVECEGLWRRHLRELRSCSSGAEWWALWLALAAAGARLPLMGLMTKTRLSALMTSSHLGEGNYDPSSTAPFCKLLKAPDNSRRDGSVALHVLERQSVCGDRLHCWWQRHAGGTQCEAGSDPGR